MLTRGADVQAGLWIFYGPGQSPTQAKYELPQVVTAQCTPCPVHFPLEKEVRTHITSQQQIHYEPNSQETDQEVIVRQNEDTILFSVLRQNDLTRGKN